MKVTSVLLALSVGMTSIVASVSLAASPNDNPFTQTLKSVPTAELPSRAALIVKKAKAKEREATTIAVVTAAVQLNSVATPMVVGAISKAVSEVAATAAATATGLQPKQAVAIAKAAAAAAPSQARKIVDAIGFQVPDARNAVALAVAEVASPAVAVSPLPPTIQPPYRPLTTTPTNVNNSTSGSVPSGGRNYAAP
ncbi:MAG: hypothetical protein HZA90_21235 [Verrucomicrobia bacterium]|nr:hypothetical protein [Verrucomicrobiota bacterium]